jgi:hypothetical protein
VADSDLNWRRMADRHKDPKLDRSAGVAGYARANDVSNKTTYEGLKTLCRNDRQREVLLVGFLTAYP